MVGLDIAITLECQPTPISAQIACRSFPTFQLGLSVEYLGIVGIFSTNVTRAVRSILVAAAKMRRFLFGSTSVKLMFRNAIAIVIVVSCAPLSNRS